MKIHQEKAPLSPHLPLIPQRPPSEWKDLDKRLLWHPFTQMQDWEKDDPLVIARTEGFYLYDCEGNRYIDGHSSLWVNIHGHCHPRFVEVLSQGVRTLDHSTLLGLGNTPSIELAQRLSRYLPSHLKHFFYSDNGSTALEVAIKMAYQFWQHRGEKNRQKFVSFSGAYHGDTLGSVSVGGIEIFHGAYRPLLFSVIHSPWPYPYRSPETQFDPEKTAAMALERLESALKAHKGEIAAVVAESRIQAANGMIVAPPGFMPEVSRLCKEYDTLFILDEVATGFLRTGKMFALELEPGVVPDLMAIAKGLSGGVLPLALTITTSEIYKAFLGPFESLKTFFHGHTYTGNPLACLAALANLELIEENRLLEVIPEKIATFSRFLERHKDHPHVGEIRQLGFMVGIELVKDRRTREIWELGEKVPQRIVLEARRRGAVIRPLGNVMVLMPAPAMPLPVLEELVEITFSSISAVTGS